jgi:hypothetical protein
MVVREIAFADTDPSPGLVIKALEIMGLEGRSSLKGPLKRNGRVVGCFVRFHSQEDADKFIQAWNGFLELRKKGGPLLGMAPMYTLPLRPSTGGGEGQISPASPPASSDEKK